MPNIKDEAYQNELIIRTRQNLNNAVRKLEAVTNDKYTLILIPHNRKVPVSICIPGSPIQEYHNDEEATAVIALALARRR